MAAQLKKKKSSLPKDLSAMKLITRSNSSYNAFLSIPSKEFKTCRLGFFQAFHKMSQFASYSNIYERQRERVGEYVRERSCEQVCTLLRVRVCKRIYGWSGK